MADIDGSTPLPVVNTLLAIALLDSIESLLPLLDAETVFKSIDLVLNIGSNL